MRCLLFRCQHYHYLTLIIVLNSHLEWRKLDKLDGIICMNRLRCKIQQRDNGFFFYFYSIYECSRTNSTLQHITEYSVSCNSIKKLINYIFCLSPFFQLCNINPCANGGTCWTSEESFYCACRPGFTGKMCEGMYNSILYNRQHDVYKKKISFQVFFNSYFQFPRTPIYTLHKILCSVKISIKSTGYINMHTSHWFFFFQFATLFMT